MRKQILVIEDNELNRALMCEILSGEYQVLEAENGKTGMEILRQHREDIALILLDVLMPVMDGYTFLDRIREDPELSLIPVIVMTQGNTEADEVAALAHGATDFVPKPYRPQVILHRVASLIKLRETAAIVNQFQYDRLTGLYSREFFFQKVRERLQENPGQEYNIVCSNIENFKLYNDVFGTREGDRLLKEVASIARSMVGGTGFCGRFAADRFLGFQERKQERRDRQNFGDFTEQTLSPSMKSVIMRWGIYEITDRSVPVEQMCDRAMLAVSSIKGQYDRYFAVYDDALRSRLLREKAITDAAETALTEKQFTVYLQPKYSLKGQCMAGAEALVRWNHPEMGFVSPGEFIPLFEKSGFIHRLDRYVWEQVCCLLRDWREKGYTILPVSVNVSRADVYQGRLTETLRDLVRKYDVDPAYLHLEITESAYAENPAQIIGTVEELREQGFIIEMDDFGSGYSSLNMLSQMKLDVLKLDMKFIQNEIAKPAERGILRDVITMAHRLHLSVVAEGVETRAQMNRLEDMGCDFVQGYYFAKPMPAAEFEQLLMNRCAPSGEPAPKRRRDDGQQVLLVADEDAGYRQRVREAFENQYRILEAPDAGSALERITGAGDRPVSAVILSMTLPENGAARLMKTIRQDPALWETAILAVIPDGGQSEYFSLALEADDFLCKLHPLADLRRRVERLTGGAGLSIR